MPIHTVHGHADVRLPNELLSIIIKELASDTENEQIARSALASCRLASRVLCSLTTPLFFSFIELAEPWGDWNSEIRAFAARAEKLNQLLSIHDNATSVRTFTLCCTPTTFANPTIATLITTILYRLPHIRNFIFESLEQPLRFPSTATDLSYAIQALCKSPNLTTLDLGNLSSFPIRIITASPNLRSLRLSGVEFFFDENPMNETSNPQLFYMDSLEADAYSISSLASGISRNKSFATYFSRIRNLQLRDLFPESWIVARCWDFILLFSETLTMLDLPKHDSLFIAGLLDSYPFDLGRLPALRHLKIQLPILSEDHLPMLSFLNRLLSISSSASGIQILEIEITWYSVDREPAFEKLFSPAEWSTLDAALTGGMFVSLGKVILDLNLAVGDCDCHQVRALEYRNLTLSYVNLLFPMFSASTNELRTLETHVKVF